MKILMVNHEFPPVGGGGGNANYYLAREMVRGGHEVAVVTSDFAGLAREEVVEGIEVRRVPTGRNRRDFATFGEMARYLLGAGRVLWRLGREREWDIVQVFFVVPSGPAGMVAGRAARAPMVVRLGGGDLPGHEPRRFRRTGRALKPLVRWMLARAQARVVNSAGLRARAEEAYPGLNFEVIENGIDLEEFRPAADRRTEGPPVILVSARLIERKGLQFLLPALGALQKAGVAFRLRVAGDGPLRPVLEAQARAEGLQDRVEWLGLRPHQELPEVYRSADLFVLPSLSEGMSNAVLEALASGLPAIVTDVPGTEELVRDGKNGFCVPPGEPGALERPLERLLKDPELRRRLGRASRAEAERFAWSRQGERYLQLYERVLAAADGKGRAHKGNRTV